MKNNFLAALLVGFFLASNINAMEPGVWKPEYKNLAIPVLCYHAVTSDTSSVFTFSPEQLEADFKYLKEHGYHPITALQFIKMQKYPEFLPPKPVVLSFDDGHKSAYTQVLPLLKKYNFQATFFICHKNVREKSNRFLTWEELSKIVQAGMDIQSHTMTHPYLTINNEKNKEEYINWLVQELKLSKEILEDKLHRKVTLLAYPFGWYNRGVEAEAIKAGYQGIFTVNWGNNGLHENPLRIKRRVMLNSMRREEFKKILTARPLEINVVSPEDASIVHQKPIIKFKLSNQEIKTVKLTIRRTTVMLNADDQGFFTLKEYLDPKPPGYCMIIIEGYDAEKNFYTGSWGFDYKPVK